MEIGIDAQMQSSETLQNFIVKRLNLKHIQIVIVKLLLKTKFTEQIVLDLL